MRREPRQRLPRETEVEALTCRGMPSFMGGMLVVIFTIVKSP
jgi:hypothetical protein